MTYLKNIRMVLIGKRILISWVIIAIIFSGVGFAICSITSKRFEQPKTAAKKEALIFGKPNGKLITDETPCEWGNGNLKFIPLDVPLNEDLQEFSFYLSSACDMDFTFVMALMKQESNFQSDVVSTTDDYGLMQINEINHPYLKEQLGISDFLDPYENIKAGVFILRKLFEKYETPEKVLMAYNMGETGASRLWEQGIFETNYTKNVLKYQQEFIEELERNGV